MTFRMVELPWLPEPSTSFRANCRAITAESPVSGLQVQRLATQRLDAGQLATLSKAIRRLQDAAADLAPLSRFRLGVVSGSTLDFLVDAMPASAARHGVALEVLAADLGQVEQEAFDPKSTLNASNCDAVLLALDHRWLGLDTPTVNGDGAERVEVAIRRLEAVMTGFSSGGAGVIVCTAACPPSAYFGSYDRRFEGSVRSMIAAFNARLPDLCATCAATLFDVAAVAEAVGTAAWFDEAFYNLYKLPFSPDAVPVYSDALGRLLGAMRGKARKCLVLDLDNTCWGGVIGDDGLEGIRIGAGSPEGESFLAVQQAALALKRRGIVLAVSSKNDEDRARAAFREHPDMLLREADIAVFQANWQDKPSNLEAIARTLDIGLDALVFLDDNAAERAQMREALPSVGVPELPADAALYPALLLGAGYFEAVGFSAEDRERSQSYATNAMRADVLARSRDLGDYLSALDMEIKHSRFDALNRTRIAQLVNKSNQFNLTTRRYTEAQIADLEQVAGFTLQTRLSDRFGDFGMIGVVVARTGKDASVWDIDTWLMSCRVLGRKVEDSMLNALVAAARDAGVAQITASYLPTAKNAMVADHFDKLGFECVASAADGARAYRLDVARYVARPTPFAAGAAS